MSRSQKRSSVILSTIKKHVFTGISFMIPLVVGAGLCLALSFVIGGTDVKTLEGTLPFYLYKVGSLGMTFVVPIITAAIAYSIADRPGIAPGLIVGYICSDIKAGFIGGIIGAFIVGYVALAIKKYVKLPKTMRGLMPILVIPFLTTLISGMVVYLFVGQPIVWLQEQLTNFILSLQDKSPFVMGAVFGALVGTDFGGPINKAMSLIANGLMVDGIYGPEAVKFLGGIIPPFGITLSYLLTRNKYTRDEKEAIKAAFPMGICMITEGVIPIAARDLWRVVLTSMLGCGVAGGLAMLWGTGSPAPAGGLFIVPMMTNPLQWCIALVIGTVVMGVSLSLLKKPVKEEDQTSVAGSAQLEGAGSFGDDEIKIETL